MAVIVTLTGSAADDGRPNPPGALTYQWSKISGPGTVDFADATDPTTTATISDPGVYVLRLTASDGALFDTDDVLITIAAIAPDFGLVEGQQNVVGIGSDGFLYRTADFQTVSGSGGPTWVQIDLGIAAKIYSWVVDPFSPGYLEGVGEINGWIVNDTDIYRVEDLFGTPSVVSVHIFATPTVGASNHWRTIQASFGAYFAEGLNPWLVCVSYHGSTLEHEGTWAIRSEDGGVTWSEEVQISALYDASTEIPEGALPIWGMWDSIDGWEMDGGGGAGGSATSFLLKTGAGSAERETWLTLAPTAHTVRIVLRVEWSNSTSKDAGTFTNGTADLNINTPPNVSETDDMVFDAAGPIGVGGGSATTGGSFTLEYELVSGVWPTTREDLSGGPPVDPATGDMLGLQILLDILGQTDKTIVEEMAVSASIIELELDNGMIYRPDEARAHPIAVWTSPRTPGKVYTAAHVSVADGPLPQWAEWDSGTSVLTPLSLSSSASVLSRSESGDLVVTVEKYLWLCPPPNTKRIAFIGSWASNFFSPGVGTGTNDSTVDIQDSSSTTLTDDLVHSVPGQSDDDSTSGTFSGEVTFANFATQDWPVNTANYLAGNNTDALRFRCRSVSNGSATNQAVCVTNIGVRVTEIELDDGTVYYPSAATDGFVSTDWGETWAAMAGNPVAPGRSFAGTIHVPWPDNQDESLVYHGALGAEGEAATPEELSPFFGVFRQYQGAEDDGETYNPLGYGTLATITVRAEEDGAVPGVEEDAGTIIIAPPPDANRMKVFVSWQCTRFSDGGSNSAGMQTDNATGTSHTGEDNFVAPPDDSSNSGNGEVEWTWASVGDWPINSETIQATPPTSLVGCRIRAYCNANGSGSGLIYSTITFTVTVLEIELDNGTIYTPTGRDFSLKKVVSGVASDVSPTDADRSYGVNRGPFCIRTFDGAGGQQYVLAAVVGNIGTNDPADDYHAVFISDDEADTWTQIVAPIPGSAAPTDRPAFEAAFGGGEGGEQILFIWGPANYIAYSSNFGVAVDDRSGNLDSFGTPEFIGIAGGPIP